MQFFYNCAINEGFIISGLTSSLLITLSIKPYSTGMTFGFPFTFNALSSVSIPQTQLSSSVATPNVSSNVIIPPVQPHFLEHYVSNWLALNDSWNLPNGQVQFDTPRIFEIGVARKKLSLSNPLFLGRYVCVTIFGCSW